MSPKSLTLVATQTARGDLALEPLARRSYRNQFRRTVYELGAFEVEFYVDVNLAGKDGKVNALDAAVIFTLANEFLRDAGAPRFWLGGAVKVTNKRHAFFGRELRPLFVSADGTLVCDHDDPELRGEVIFVDAGCYEHG